MALGENIRNIRKEKKLSQVTVAETAQIAVNSLRLYEAGKRDPSISTIYRIASALGVNVEKLIGGQQYDPEEEFEKLDKIGLHIKTVRQWKNVTQEQLAKKMGVDRSVISKYESGQITPSVAVIKRIAVALEVDPSSLMDWDTAGDYMMAHMAEQTRMKRIEKAFFQLNEEGQEKAVDRVEELAEVSRLRKDPTQPPDIGPLSEAEDEQLFPPDPELEEDLRAEELQDE